MKRRFQSKVATQEDPELISSMGIPNLHLFIKHFLLKNNTGLTEHLMHSKRYTIYRKVRETVKKGTANPRTENHGGEGQY